MVTPNFLFGFHLHLLRSAFPAYPVNSATFDLKVFQRISLNYNVEAPLNEKPGIHEITVGSLLGIFPPGSAELNEKRNF